MNKKAFTLIELIGTIVLISLMVLIIVPTVSKTIKKSETSSDKNLEDSIILAARNWSSDNKAKLKSLQTGWEYNLAFETLQTEGYLDEEIKNPSTKENYSKNHCIIIKKISEKQVYTYRIENNNCNSEFTEFALSITGKEAINNGRNLDSGEWTKYNVRLSAIDKESHTLAGDNYLYNWSNEATTNTTNKNEYLVKTEPNSVTSSKYKVQMRVDDRWTTQASNDFEVKIDKKAPNPTATLQYTGKNEIIVSYTESDQNSIAQSGLKENQRIFYTINSKDYDIPLTYSNDKKSASATIQNSVLTKLDTGSYDLYVKEGIEDNVGNKANSLKIGSFTIDNTKPSISLNPNTQSSYIKGGKAVTVTLSDQHSGLVEKVNVSYAWSTSNQTAPTNWQTLTATNVKYAKTASVTVPATASSSLTGAYYLWIKSGISDMAGNTTSDNTTSNVFYFDNTKPTCTLTAPSSITYDSTGNFTLKCTDTNSGLNSQTLSSNNFEVSNLSITSVSSPTAITNGYQYTITTKATKGTGTGTLSLKASSIKDRVENLNDKISANTSLARARTATTGSCNTLTYNAKEQTLAQNGKYVSYSNNTRTDAGSQNVTATADSNHLFSDGAASKTFSCSIGRLKTATTGSCISGLYKTGSPQTLASGAVNATYSNNTRTDPGTQTVTVTANSNYAFSDGNTTKTLSCTIKDCTPSNSYSQSGGGAAGPGPSYFQTRIEMRITSRESTRAYIQYRCYIQVTSGNFWNSIIQWTNFTYVGCSLGTSTGTFCDTGWQNLGWYNYNSTAEKNCYAGYTSGSVGNVESSVTGRFTPKNTC